MSADREELARIIATIRDKDKYVVIDKGYFIQAPDIEGYLYKVPNNDKLGEYKIYVLVNTNTGFIYPSKKTEIKNNIVLVYNTVSFEKYVSEATIVAGELVKVVEDIIARVEEERDKDLPYGYKRDDSGKIILDTIKADEVKDIFKGYIEMKSMNKLAKELGTNFSHVHDVLNDERYETFKPSIVSKADIKAVNEIMQGNQKNKVTVADTSRVAQLKKKLKAKIRR